MLRPLRQRLIHYWRVRDLTASYTVIKQLRNWVDTLKDGESHFTSVASTLTSYWILRELMDYFELKRMVLENCS